MFVSNTAVDVSDCQVVLRVRVLLHSRCLLRCCSVGLLGVPKAILVSLVRVMGFHVRGCPVQAVPSIGWLVRVVPRVYAANPRLIGESVGEIIIAPGFGTIYYLLLVGRECARQRIVGRAGVVVAGVLPVFICLFPVGLAAGGGRGAAAGVEGRVVEGCTTRRGDRGSLDASAALAPGDIWLAVHANT